MENTKESQRLTETRENKIPWKKWGPYLSERQWGTVREDYSPDGNAWDYFSHDQARSRAYRWGEDGLAGISDEKQQLCFALALWNGQDPILKERLFGLTNSEGNHGEDVKEYYFYLDNTPTHSYMKYLYKYPQSAYPYADIIVSNRNRSKDDYEYELLDTGVFDENRYFDVFVEYAKAAPEDILIQITAFNRGPDAAELHLLPALWYRNTWSCAKDAIKPSLKLVDEYSFVIAAEHPELGVRYLYCSGKPEVLFTENETNNVRINGTPNSSPYVKDGINNYLINKQLAAVNPEQRGTKSAGHYRLTIGAGLSMTIQLRLTDIPPAGYGKKNENEDFPFGPSFDQIFADRQAEADEFYRSLTPPGVSADAASIMRQTLAGMLWSKQYYYLNAEQWLDEHHASFVHKGKNKVRNTEWFHMINEDIISMPDKWEYPWYAAWDLAFHTMALSMVDSDFAKSQLNLVLQGLYLHPNGQIPAYEWNFSDVNPPVHAWAAIFFYRLEQALNGYADVDFIKTTFNKLMLNFTWWVNRKDRFGKNVFEGGFLGLDNIGVFDRSAPLPNGGHLEQADGTAWMALFCQNMMEMAVEISVTDPTYGDLVGKFCEHFLWIATAMNHPGEDSMWDEEDGFYYDLLRFPDGRSTRLKVRSMVGLLPICATTVVESWQRELVPHVVKTLQERLNKIPELRNFIHPTGVGHFGVNERGIMALVRPERLKRILARMLDENEFLSDYGIRSLSKFHKEHPYVFWLEGKEYRVEYLPAESNTGMFGGNSNWRGPIWLPVNVLLIRALLQFYLYYGDTFKVECPTGSGNLMNLFEVSEEISKRLQNIFLRNEKRQRAVYGGTDKFQNDPYWRDHILFYEYFHGDNGAGLGASHQTGWTGLIARLIQIYGYITPQDFLEAGKRFSVMAELRK